ncbi:MAG: pyrroline-5-carboxylate reductase [Bacteroidota bacterium]|nr:pyrroline-5-carboxylate reductase [Bacteroidota bacterium]MDE2834301.1 pyrroline-5-carboxylate reductase [Bacteroidota bacterium]MDE2955714.1 pyrroline-5-carboxylate reductase [Bacteroidota bacterium]
MTLNQQTLAVLGAGNIGRALIGGLINGGHIAATQVYATRRRKEALAELANQYPGVHTDADNVAASADATVIVLSVKPANVAKIIEEIRDHVNEDTLIISVLAGLTTESIREAFGKARLPVVRTMPNTPMLVRQGATAITPGTHAGEHHLALVRRMFEAVGTVVRVPEYLMDAVTGLSGSGPAYVYTLIEALTDAGVKQGLPRPTAFKLSTQTVLGAAHLVANTEKHPAILRDEVTTPGGTAIAAIAELEKHGMRTMFINAVATATGRSRELSRKI